MYETATLDASPVDFPEPAELDGLGAPLVLLPPADRDVEDPAAPLGDAPPVGVCAAPESGTIVSEGTGCPASAHAVSRSDCIHVSSLLPG